MKGREARTTQGPARMTQGRRGGREAEVGIDEAEAEGRTAAEGEVGVAKTEDAVGVERDGGAGAGREGGERGGEAKRGETKCEGRAQRSCREV